MRGNELILDVCSDAQFIRRSQKDANLSFADTREQRLFLLRCVIVMNKGNLLFRHAFLHEFFPNIGIDSEGSFRVRRGLIAENHLRGLLVRGLFVNLIHVIDAKVDLAVRIIRVAWINDAGIQRGRLSLLHDNKHIIHAFTGGLICIRT